MQNKVTKVPMAQRLSRLQAGYPSSPLYSQKVVERFADTPIAPTLEAVGAFRERERLSKLYRKAVLPAKQKRIGLVTFRDVATLISNYCMLYSGEKKSGTHETGAVQQLIGIYFLSLDMIDDFAQKLHSRFKPQYRSPAYRELDPNLRNVYDFMYVSYEDYRAHIAKYLPRHFINRLNVYAAEAGFSAGVNPMMIYVELKRCKLGLSEFDIFDDETLPTVSQCRQLVDFFVHPIAMAAGLPEPKENTPQHELKGEISNEKE